MGKFTGEIEYRIRPTDRGSDYFGNCEVCNCKVSETFVGQQFRKFQRDTGEFYYSPIDGGVYGHFNCVKPTSEILK